MICPIGQIGWLAVCRRGPVRVPECRWSEGSAPITSMAMARVVSYAGGAMIWGGGTMIGAARRMVAAVAAVTAAALVAMVWRGSGECGG